MSQEDLGEHIWTHQLKDGVFVEKGRSPEGKIVYGAWWTGANEQEGPVFSVGKSARQATRRVRSEIRQQAKRLAR